MAASLLTFSQTQNALTSLGELGLTIDWLDPEPRKPYTGPVPCIAVIDGKQIPGELVAGADGKPVFRLGPLADQLKG